MVRVRSFLEVGEVATHARCIGDVVVAINVTLRALDCGVGTRKRPASSGVIECRGSPVRGRVTDFALLRKSSRDVIGIVRALVILQVARDASRVADVVIPIDMALRALHFGVRAGEGKGCLGMIKRGRLPDRGGVADLALLRESGSDVVGIGGSLKVLQVAGNASVAGEIEIASRVALLTLQLGMRSGQRKSDRIVIEIRRLPPGCVVTLLASLGKSQTNVVGIARLLKIEQVAAHARSWCTRVFSAHVTCGAFQRGMHSS